MAQKKNKPKNKNKPEKPIEHQTELCFPNFKRNKFDSWL